MDSSSNSRGGGIFLILAIMLGAGWGIMIGNPMLGVLRGTGIGIVLAIAIWLIDRRRSR